MEIPLVLFVETIGVAKACGQCLYLCLLTAYFIDSVPMVAM